MTEEVVAMVANIQRGARRSRQTMGSSERPAQVDSVNATHLRVDLVLVRQLLGEVGHGDGVAVGELELRRRLARLLDG